MRVVKIAMTVADKEGEVQLIMQGDLPDNCIAIFVKKEDYEEVKALLEVSDGT